MTWQERTPITSAEDEADALSRRTHIKCVLRRRHLFDRAELEERLRDIEHRLVAWTEEG